MVLYGYGCDLEEQDANEHRSHLDDWNRERNRIYGTLLKEDRQILESGYDTFPDRCIFYNCGDFADAIAWRIYTEACMNPNEKFNAGEYQGEAFLKFVGDETNYAIERIAKGGLDINPNEVRIVVLEGLIKRGIEFFDQSDKTKNLRCDLRNYIGF